jgi:hypothetical protein
MSWNPLRPHRTFTRRHKRRRLAVELLEHRLALATYSVMETGSEGDSNPNDGVCMSTSPSHGCTLSAAIQQTEADGGGGEIVFGIGGTFGFAVGLSVSATIDGANHDITLPGGLRLSKGGTVRNARLHDSGIVFNERGVVENVSLTDGSLAITRGGGEIRNSQVTNGIVELAGDGITIQDLIINGPAPANLLIRGNTASLRNVSSSVQIHVTGDNLFADDVRLSNNSFFVFGSSAMLRGLQVTNGIINVIGGGGHTLEQSFTTNGFVTVSGGNSTIRNVTTSGVSPPELNNGIMDHGIHVEGSNIVISDSDTTQIVFSSNSSSDNSRVVGNVISGFADGGLGIRGDGIVIQDNFIGTNRGGTSIRGASASGASVEGNGNTIANNVISGTRTGLSVGGDKAVVRENKIGTNAAGDAVLGNNLGLDIVGTNATVDRNTISGNSDYGVRIIGSNNTLLQNRIGTDTAGARALGNGSYGVFISGGSGNVIKNNVISGTGTTFAQASGVFIKGDDANGNRIEGNFIGTDASGTVAMGNVGYGIRIENGDNNTIGGTAAEARNIISGNGIGVAILRRGPGLAIGNLIQGNFIGTNFAGTTAIPNFRSGIAVAEPSTTIGGNSDGAGNLISGNLEDGINIAADNVTIIGNFIGTNLAGTAGLGNLRDGLVYTGTNGVIGDANSGNLIAANGANGLRILGNNNTVIGNSVGVTFDGKTNLGNARVGIQVSGDKNKIGTNSVSGNTIAFNGRDLGLRGHGIEIIRGTGNSIRYNSIYKNRGRGIDLLDNLVLDSFLVNDSGVTREDGLLVTDPDMDTGPNELQNHPVVKSVDPSIGAIHWMLDSNPNTEFMIDFYEDPENAFTEYGEGAEFKGSLPAKTDEFGHAEFTTFYGVERITAIATDADDNSSEFSLMDADADSLADTWETTGIDTDENGTVDLIVPDANRLHKDLYVEVDAMRGNVADDDRVPSQNVFDLVRGAFARAPVGLVRNPDGNDGISLHIPEVGIIPFDPLYADPWGEFDRDKRAYFGNPRGNVNTEAARRLVYRYAIFANAFGAGTAGGRSELGHVYRETSARYLTRGGNDFMITQPPGLADESLAGTFMHELGHTLGLRHGGDEDLNYKPNYYSIMNYSWQFPNLLTKAGKMAPEETYADSWRLDYSRSVLPPLDEAALVERDGIGGDPAILVPAGPALPLNYPFRLVPQGGGVDWDRRGTIGGISVADINNSGAIENLVGYEDWSNLVFNFQESSSFRDGEHAGDEEDEPPTLPSFPDEPLQVRFAEHSSQGGEQQTLVHIPVVLTVSASQPVTVRYSITGGSATRDGDYSLADGILTIRPGQTFQTISVNIVNDSEPETHETIRLTLSQATHAELGPIFVHTYTILDDDSPVPGDANGDGVFNSADLVLVFQAGEYEDDISGNSTFAEGDWNGDGDFNSSDLVVAFQAGTYVAAANPNSVPAIVRSVFDSPNDSAQRQSCLDAPSVDLALESDLGLADL